MDGFKKELDTFDLIIRNGLLVIKSKVINLKKQILL